MSKSLIKHLLSTKLSQESAVDDSAIPATTPEEKGATPAPELENTAPAAPATTDDTPAPVGDKDTPAAEPAADVVPETDAVTAPEGGDGDDTPATDPATPTEPVEPAEGTEAEATPATEEPVADPVEPATDTPAAEVPAVDAGDATGAVEPSVDPEVPAVDATEPPAADTDAAETDPVTAEEPTEPLEQLPEGDGSNETEAVQAAEAEGDEPAIDSDTETDEDLSAKADAVAEYTVAAQSLEELCETIEESLQDGGLTPEASVIVQDTANDVLSDVGEEPIGLPSMESYSTFVGRQQNTRLTLESIGEKAKELGAKAAAAGRALIEAVIKAVKALVAKMTKSSVVVKQTQQLTNSFVKKTQAAQGDDGTLFKYPASFWDRCGIKASGVVHQQEFYKREGVIRKGLLAALRWGNEGGVKEFDDLVHPDVLNGVFERVENTSEAQIIIPTSGDYVKLLAFIKQMKANMDSYFNQCDQALIKLRKAQDAGTDVTKGVRQLQRLVAVYAQFTETMAMLAISLAK